MKFYVLILLNLILANLCTAQYYPESHRSLHFDVFKYSDETPFVPANSVCQDQEGLMWFGTQWGLYSYDGYQSNHFHTETESGFSIIHNEVNVVIESKTGSLWIGTNGGLTVVDPTRKESQHFLHQNARAITCLFEDKQGMIWVGTRTGLISINPQSKDIKQYRFNSDDPNSLPNLRIMSINQDLNGYIWISFHISSKNTALVRLHPKNESVKVFYTPKETDNNPFEYWNGDLNKTIFISYINTIGIDPSGMLWLGPWWGDLTSFDPNTFEFNSFIPTNYFNGELHKRIRRILNGPDGRLWIASYAFGISRFDPKNNHVYIEKPDRFISTSLRDSLIHDIYFDRYENLWVLSDGVIEKFDPYQYKYQYYQYWNGKTHATEFRDIVEENEEILWFATSDGLIRFDTLTNEYLIFFHDPTQKNTIPHNNITALHLDDENQLWIGTNSDGVSILNTLDFTIKHFDLFPGNLSDNKGYLHDITADKDGNIWFATRYSGIVRYNPKTNQNDRFFEIEVENSDIEVQEYFGIVNKLYSTQDGRVWVGTDIAGIFEFLPETETFYHHKYSSGVNPVENAILGKRIKDIAEDSSGQLWIGTDQALNRFDPNTLTVNHWTRANGLANGDVQAILPNDDQSIWFSTKYGGIIKFDLNSSTFYTYYNDINNTEDNFNPFALKRKNGTLCFSSLYGVYSIAPILQKSVSNSLPPQIKIHEINVLGDMYTGDQINLSYWQNTITIQYSIIHFSNPEQNRSMYKFAKISENVENWVESFGSNTVTFFNLEPGHYQFHLTGANSDGIWKNEPVEITFHISSPFWEALWFQIACILLLILTVFTFVKWRFYRIQQLNQTLENLVDKRTHQLAIEMNYSRQVIDSSPSIILGYYPNGKLSFLNPTVRNMFGISNGSIPDQHWWTITPNEDEQSSLYQIHLNSQWDNHERFESMISDVDQNKHQIDWNLIHRYSDEGEIVETIAFGNDITERIEQQFIEVSHKEQQRIGREIHDGICQQLTGISLMCESLIGRKEHILDRDINTLQQMKKHIKRITKQSRHLAHGLYLHELEQYGLQRALQELTVQVKELFSIDCEWKCNQEIMIINYDHAVHLYRIIQEALNNAVKYSQSKMIELSVISIESQLTLCVKDFGIGFETGAINNHGMGINVMKFRAKIINATLDIQSQIGKGTTILCTFKTQ